MNDPRLYLVVTVGPDIRLLDMFINHYKRLGVDEFLVIVHMGDNQNYMDKRYQSVYAALKAHGIEPVSSWSGKFSEKSKQYYERLIIETRCRTCDWVVYADLDEFQSYRFPLGEVVEELEDRRIEFITGRLLDRIAYGGEIIDLDENKSLDAQFPMAGFLTSKVLRAWDWKIAVARVSCIVGGGHHVFLLKDRRLPDGSLKPAPYKLVAKHRVICYKKEIVHIHHFKWDSGVFSRIGHALSCRDRSLRAWREEAFRFLKHYKKHGRVNVDDPRLGFRPALEFF